MFIFVTYIMLKSGLMKILFFLSLMMLASSIGYTQTQIIPLDVFGVEHYKIEEYNLPAQSGSAFVAVQGTEQPVTFRYTPGGSGWEYHWNRDGGTWNVEGNYGTDSVDFSFQVMQPGLYTISANKENASEQSFTFRVFFAEVADFSVVISDKEACDYIRVGLTGYTPAEYNGFNGNGTVLYSILKGNDERVLAAGSNPMIAPIAEIPTWEDVDYRIKVKDGFGFEWTSESASYVSVIPKAVPEIILGNTVDIVGEVNEEMGQAPLEVEFNADDCVNADEYQWLLYKDTSTMGVLGSALLDSLIGEQIRMEDHFVYTYENTGRYKVRLIAVNTVGVNQCKDTAAAKYINVIESLLEVPNVFTPNGDGKNDVFMVKGLSLEDFHGVILNRWGRKVYEWSDPQGGWDGRIHGKYANPGTYYYIITARGREKSNPPKYVKKGALMLIR